MLSLGGEKLPPPPPPSPPPKKEKRKKKRKRKFGSLPAPRSGMPPLLCFFVCSFTHLRMPRSPPKFNQFFIVLPQDPSIKFHPNRSMTFWVMLSTDRQTNQRYQKHNLLCQGGKYILFFAYKGLKYKLAQLPRAIDNPLGQVNALDSLPKGN